MYLTRLEIAVQSRADIFFFGSQSVVSMPHSAIFLIKDVLDTFYPTCQYNIRNATNPFLSFVRVSVYVALLENPTHIIGCRNLLGSFATEGTIVLAIWFLDLLLILFYKQWFIVSIIISESCFCFICVCSCCLFLHLFRNFSIFDGTYRCLYGEYRLLADFSLL